MIVVCVTAARTNELCKAITAFFAGEQAGVFEPFTNLGLSNSVPNVAHIKLLIRRKLVAGIQVAVG